MNYRMIKTTLGWLLMFEAGFFLVPLITGIIYKESATFAFLASLLITAAVASLFIFLAKPKTNKLYSKDGFVIVALSWIALSIFGALPFLFSGVIPSFVDALFESASGFTTTGASIMADVESAPRCIIMWRSFTHWVGGMGVLVFVMAFLPLSGAQNLHIMKAESPGPSVSKLVPRVRTTALILYIIYFSLTLIQFLLLLIGGAGVFDSLNIAFATAGTGGFGIRNDGMSSFSSYIQIVTTIFMLIFSINFGSYYLILKGKIKDAFNSEVRAFLIIVVVAITIITINVADTFSSVGEAIKHVAFSVASIISTTGFSTADFNLWPELSRAIIVLIMFIGACAGSTGGGMKVSRFIIWFKGVIREISAIIHPKQVKKISVDGKPVEHEVVRSVNAYIVCYIVVFIVSFVALTFENTDMITNFTAVSATLNNIGPGLELVGPTQNFAFFSIPSKLVLTFNMLAGRLELFPMLVLFNPATYRR